MNFKIVWEIEIEAETFEEAAMEALRIQRDTESTATVFQVTNTDTEETDEIDVQDLQDIDIPANDLPDIIGGGDKEDYF